MTPEQKLVLTFGLIAFFAFVFRMAYLANHCPKCGKKLIYDGYTVRCVCGWEEL